MVNAAGDGGGGGSVIGRLDPLFTEIADLLGQLAANQISRILLDAEANKPLEYPWTRVPASFTIPGPHGFQLEMPLVTLQPASEEGMTSPVTDEDRRRELQQLIDSTWEKTRTHWSASAIPSEYRALSRNVWEPDAGAMSSATTQLGDIALWLFAQQSPDAGWAASGTGLAPDWLADLEKHWPRTSVGATSFQAFWDDVNEKCSLYLHAAQRLASTSAQVTATVSDFQTNLVEATEKVRDRAIEALEQWQIWRNSYGMWPSGALRDNGTAKTILGGVSYATGVISLFPPAAVVAGPISVLTGGLTYLVEDKTVLMEAIQAATADEIHAGFLGDLDVLTTNLDSALDGVRTQPPADGGTTGSQGFGSYTADVVANREDWRPEPVHI